MAGSTVVYTDVSNPNNVSGDLFKDMKFWLSKTVPSRSWMKQIIEANGGKVVFLEKDADVLLVDHMKPNNPPGSTSFQYVEKSIRNGSLENIEDHRAGPPSDYIRPVGSAMRQKGHRTTFTPEDDQTLYDWVKPFEENGGRFRGNKIYQQLAEKYPHHTYQSWRDHYLKKVRDRPRPVTPERQRSRAAAASEPARGPSNEEHAQPEEPEDTSRMQRSRSNKTKYEKFTAEEKEDLLKVVKYILNINPGKEDEAWAEYAKDTGKSATEWKSFFRDVVLPEYKAEKSKEGSRHRALQAPHRETIATSSTSLEMKRIEPPRTDRGGSFRRPSVPNQQPPSPHTHQEVNGNGKRPRTSTDSSPIRRESASFQSRKRRIAEPAPQETVSPSAASGRSRIRASMPRSTHSRHPSSTLETPSKSKPSTSHNNKPTPTSRAVSATNSDQFETAPQPEGALQSHYQTPPQVLDRRNEFNNSPTPRPTPARAAPTSKPPAKTKAKTADERLAEWFHSKTEGPNACSRDQAFEAMDCTTMIPDLAEIVLEHFARGEGIPSDARGVWTKEDDERLQAADSRGVEALLKKHGNELFNMRFDYLLTRENALEQRNGEQSGTEEHQACCADS